MPCEQQLGLRPGMTDLRDAGLEILEILHRQIELTFDLMQRFQNGIVGVLRHARLLFRCYADAMHRLGMRIGRILINALFDLAAKMPDQTLDWPSRRVAQSADRMAFDLRS